MMKVLLAQKVLDFAGSEIYLLNLLPTLRQYGIDAHFALFCDDEQTKVTLDYKSRLQQKGVPTHIFRLNKLPKFSQLKKINKHLVAENYDLVHTHLLLSDMAFALIKTFFNRNIKIVSTKHGYTEAYTNTHGFQPVFNFWEPYRLISYVVEKKISRSFAVSKALKDLYVGMRICDQGKIDVIYHGFDYEPVQATEAFRYASKQVTIVGRLTAFKGHRFLIEAMKAVLVHHPEAKLAIVGDGPLKEELVQMVKSLALTDNVVFTGFQPNPRQIVASSDVAAIPSVAEAFGLVLVEAMATKKPIVAFAVPTPTEILKNEETALLAKPFEVDELAENIIRLLTDKSLALALATKAHALQVEKFTLSIMASNTISFYRKVLAER